MTKLLPIIERMGIRPQFQRVKPYLKSYICGFDDQEYQGMVEKLSRYIAEGEFDYVPEIDPFGLGEEHYDVYPAFHDLVGIYWTLRWRAVQAALGEEDDWQNQWQRSVAYGNMAYRVTKHSGNMLLEGMTGNIADCLVLGWQERGIELAKLTNWGLENNRISDSGKDYHYRTAYFVLRVIADQQGWPEKKWPDWALDEPLFNALIEHWRTPNPDDIAPLLLALCDRHTHESQRGNGSNSYDIETIGFWYDPYEILLVMKLRQMEGLENPVLDHLLMNTPLGKLPEPAPLYTDELLGGLAKRMKIIYPDF
jgi:hypothetical protein